MCHLVWSQEVLKAQQAGKEITTFCRCRQGRHDRWDLVRYEIEQEHHMVHERPTKGADSCIIGMRLCDFGRPLDQVFILGEDVQMQRIGPVVLVRCPVPTVNGRHRPNTFIPNKIREALALAEQNKQNEAKRARLHQTIACAADEDAKLTAFLTFDDGRVGDTPAAASYYYKKYPHPSAAIARARYAGFINYNGEFVPWADAKPIRPPPPPHWQCQRCNNFYPDVHYAEDCPSLEITDWIPMSKRTRPVGIPRSRLRAVNLNNLAEVATAPYVDDHGHLWVQK